MFERYGHFLFKWRNYLFPIILITLFLIFPPTVFKNDLYNTIIIVTGILVVITGQVVRAAVIGLVYIKRGGVDKKIYADTLVTDGIFKHCRNPLYVGNLLIIAGFLILHSNPWVYLIGGLFFLISYQAIVTAEETFLSGKFGSEFEEYCRHTGRWFINPIGLSATMQSMQFNWRRVLAKDYSTMATWMIVVLFLMILKHVRQYGFNNSEFLVATLVIFAAIAIFAVSVRVSKKTGKLKHS